MGNGHEIYLTVWVTVTIVALVTVSNFLFSKIRQQYVSVEGYERGNSLRVVAIFQLISMMAALSLIIYYHLFSFFQYPGTVISFSSKAELRKCNRRCFYVFLFVMFGGHFAYVLYLFDYVPWVIFELFNIFCGFWMHLFFFSFLFFYGNFVTSLLENFPLGQRFLSFLTRPSFMKSIVYDSQVQVATTVFLTLAMSYIQWFASDKLSVHSASFNLTHPLPSPLQVVVLTDIHSGASVYESQVADVVDKVNEMNADVVFLNGDTIDAPVDRIYDRVEPLRHLKSKYGVFMVSGNHEYYYGNWNDWVSHFEGMGITVLQNNVSTVSSVCFVGLNDISSYKSGIYNHFMDVSALSQCGKYDNIIVMEHNPAAAPKIVNASKQLDRNVDLIVSGHTHAGQFYVMIPYVYWFLPFWYGTYEIETTKLLVSAGTLYQAAPMKMVGMSQIWALTLH